jgi:hypothetical protein
MVGARTIFKTATVSTLFLSMGPIGEGRYALPKERHFFEPVCYAVTAGEG